MVAQVIDSIEKGSENLVIVWSGLAHQLADSAISIALRPAKYSGPEQQQAFEQ
jgi:hypothetical protein